VAGRKIEIQITGDSRDLEKALGRATKSTQTFGQKVTKGAKVAGLAIGAGLAVAAKVGFDELAEGQRVAAQTQAALKSTGGVANVTAGHIEDLAGKLQKLSGADDEAIQAGENLLLTFTNIQNRVGKGNDIFDQATKTMVDMSVALGQDSSQSALQLGKALNDPVRGLTALRKVGVSFTKGQEKQIAAMVKAGDVAGAQKVILKELQKEFGGSAKAAGETLPGKLAIAKGQFENMAGALMESLLPALTVIAEKLTSFANFLSEHEGLTKVLVIGLGALAAALLAASAAQTLLNLAVLANPYVAVAAAIIALGAAVVLAWKKFETFRNIVTGAIDFVREHWRLLLAILLGPLGIAIGLAVKHFGTVKKVATTAFNAIRDAIGFVIDKVRIVVNWLKDKLGNPAVRKAIENAVLAPFHAIRDAIQFVIDKVQSLIDKIRSIPSPGDIIGGIAGHLPHFAEGTRNFRGGLALVGERGPELVNLSRGSDVIPLRPGAGAAMRVGAPTVMNFHFGNYVGDRRELIKTITHEVDRIARGTGGRRPF
jgi:phage-related protein